MRAELRAIQKRTGVTFIYITHDQGEALAMSDRVGVMSQGVLQQVATPQEIYNNPTNGFVASFVGENNVFSGRVKSAADGMAVFETPKGNFSAKLGQNVAVGDTSKLYVRPEFCTLHREADAKANSIAVEVSEIAFEGNFVNVFVKDHSGDTHMVQVQNDPSVPPPALQTSCQMVFNPASCMILAEANTGHTGH
jgi:spermidine/putrescine transport system ATP-binding protein